MGLGYGMQSLCTFCLLELLAAVLGLLQGVERVGARRSPPPPPPTGSRTVVSTVSG